MSEGQSIFDKAKDMAGNFVGGNKDKVRDGVDQAGDAVDERTGGQYDEQVDQGQESAWSAVDRMGLDGEDGREDQEYDASELPDDTEHDEPDEPDGPDSMPF